MSWHITGSLVNELISAQREQLNTGSSCCLWQTGEMESLQGRSSCFRGCWNYIFFCIFWFYYLYVFVLWVFLCLIRVSEFFFFFFLFFCLVRECGSLLTWCYWSREGIQLYRLWEGICVEVFCPSKRIKVSSRRTINPSACSCLVMLGQRLEVKQWREIFLCKAPNICFIPTREQVVMKAVRERALLPPELSRLQGALWPHAAILFCISPVLSNLKMPLRAAPD